MENTRAVVPTQAARARLRLSSRARPVFITHFTKAPSKLRMIGKTISHYRILDQIGEGGMGVVYVAEDLLLGRRVAIKLPHAGRDESHYRARFMREARAVSLLNHKNIAAVYDLGETDDGQLYIVMELVPGQTLGDVLAGPGLSLARAVDVIREVAEALSEAHRRGIVHRDIKPSNVIFNERGEVKVLDFGLAKQLDEEFTRESNPDAATLLSARTRSDVVIGTPLYLSPEQARGAKVDGRSDLFALGALLYECLTGRPAFSGANVIEIGAQVLHFDPPPPSSFNQRVPPELDRLTLKALAKKAEDRFQTADEFAAELARVRSRLSDTDTTRTRRLATAEHLMRSSALMSVAQTLRRPRFSPLTLVGALAALLAVVFVFLYWRSPVAHKPSPGALALYNQGSEAMREGEYYEASGLFKRAVDADPGFALAHARLAEAWMEQDFLDRAKDELLTAASLVPDRTVLEREDALYLDAVSSTAMRSYGAALKAYQELAQLKKNTPQVYVDLGRAYDKNNETEKALGAFNEAVARDPSYAAAFINIGALHARQKNLAGATSAFDRAEELYIAAGNREGEAEVHFQRGRLLIDLGKVADARLELERSLAIARETKNQYQQAQALIQLPFADSGDPQHAQGYARDGIELAEAEGMPNLAALGHIRLATLLLKGGDYDGAQQHLNRALDFAHDYKVKRLEALSAFLLGSLYNKQGRQDDAFHYASQAREFYLQGNYRKEADSAQMLVGRIKRQQGDYLGAIETFEGLLHEVMQAGGDMSELCDLQREYGSVLLTQQRYPEAIAHFRESVVAARALRNQALLSYPLYSLAKSLWPLARYKEAGEALKEVTDIAGQGPTPDKSTVADAGTTEAFMLLSQGNYADAGARAKQALALAQTLSASGKGTVFNADLALCLAETYGGGPKRDRQSCGEVARLSAELNDPSASADAQMALAEAALAGGDAQGARDAALRAEEFFARSGRVESDWRALAVAGIASRRAGDEEDARQYLSRAAALLSQYEQSLGPDSQGYLSRADVRRLTSALGDAAAVAAVR